MAGNLKEHNYTEIDATIIADSLSPEGHRLTSFILTMPRIVLAEFNTHRAISRNSASSRAIPFKKMVKMAKETPFIPIAWQKDHSGMQGKEYLDGREEFDVKMEEYPDYQKLPGPLAAQELWLKGRDSAVEYASQLNDITGVTKQICNRMLEPYMWHTVICTASEWENFFALRAEDSAEIHIQALAYKMLDEYNKNTPATLKESEWHIPFGDNIDTSKIDLDHFGGHFDEVPAKVKIATARCARVSYLNFEGKDDYGADIKLHDMLAKMGHWSPFEHCAKVMDEEDYETYTFTTPKPYITGDSTVDSEYFDLSGLYANHHKGWSGNFRGFIQYRKTFDNENKKDERVNEKT